ncbi:hypothetical protein, partial [uncultured Prevotella sp.]|uniref:hypothetical protein n=2 Tax=Prevotella TaxID=838 RepID=UPI0027E21BA1
MVDNFLCNGVMMLLLLLNIVNIVVLKNNWLYIFSFNDNTDNGRQFFVQWSNDAFIIVEHCQYCRFKKQLALYFLVLTTIQTMVDKFFVQYRQW